MVIMEALMVNVRWRWLCVGERTQQNGIIIGEKAGATSLLCRTPICLLSGEGISLAAPHPLTPIGQCCLLCVYFHAVSARRCIVYAAVNSLQCVPPSPHLYIHGTPPSDLNFLPIVKCADRRSTASAHFPPRLHFFFRPNSIGAKILPPTNRLAETD